LWYSERRGDGEGGDESEWGVEERGGKGA
jgi:hypothetical protein